MNYSNFLVLITTAKRKVMKLIIASILFAITMTTTLSAQAAVIRFDVDALPGFLSGTVLNGSFFLDTDTQLLSEVDLTSGAGAFDSGFAIDNASGFGLANTSFFFSGAAELLFELPDFDRFTPGLAPGESILLSAFVSQADEFNGIFQNTNPSSANSELFSGNITATRVANAVSTPASLSLLAVFFAGFALSRRRS
jgi:hypothetical protein